MLTHIKYEAFKMEDSERINVMYNLFNDIVVALQNLDKDLDSHKINRKLLASFLLNGDLRSQLLKKLRT